MGKILSNKTCPSCRKETLYRLGIDGIHLIGCKNCEYKITFDNDEEYLIWNNGRNRNEKI